MSRKLNPQDWQLLSAYMDGALSPRQRAKLETRLDSEPELTQALLQLQQTRRILRSIPRKQAPRSFALTPAMAARSRRTPLFSALRLSSVAAAALSVLLAVFGLLPQMAQMPVSTAPMAYEEAAPDAVAPLLAATEESNAAPPIIQWGQQPGEGAWAGGMGGGGDGNYTADSAPGDTAVIAEVQPTAADQPQPSDPRLMPTPTPEIGLLAPPPAATPAPELPVQETAVPEPTAAPTEQPKALIDENSQPIMGVAPAEERGQMTAPSPLPTVQVQTYDEPAPRSVPMPRLWLLWGTVISGAMSLVLAFAAWRVRRR